jgi:Sulfotransferase family
MHLQRVGSPPFILATIPKVACTNLRKLTQVLIRDDPYHKTPRKGHSYSFRDGSVHNTHLPTVWHYEQPNVDLSGRLPSFLVARNPYVRLLSGFLDKMAIAGGTADTWNRAVRCDLNASLPSADTLCQPSLCRACPLAAWPLNLAAVQSCCVAQALSALLAYEVCSASPSAERINVQPFNMQG